MSVLIRARAQAQRSRAAEAGKNRGGCTRGRQQRNV